MKFNKDNIRDNIFLSTSEHFYFGSLEVQLIFSTYIHLQNKHKEASLSVRVKGKLSAILNFKVSAYPTESPILPIFCY